MVVSAPGSPADHTPAGGPHLPTRFLARHSNHFGLPMRRRRSALKKVAIAALFVVGVFPTIGVAIWETLHGRGAGAYRNVYGLAIHYTSVLFAVGAAVAALFVAFIGRLIYFWRTEREYKALIASRRVGRRRDGE